MNNCTNYNNCNCGENVRPNNGGQLYARFCNMANIEKYACPPVITPSRLRLGTPYNTMVNRTVPPYSFKQVFCSDIIKI